MAKLHGNGRGANLSHWCTPFKTIQMTTMETKKTVTSAPMRILSTPFTKNQVKVSFQDHPPNVPKMDPNLVLPRLSSLKTCKKGSFKTIEDGSKNDTSFKTMGEKGKNSTSFKTMANRVKNLNP